MASSHHFRARREDVPSASFVPVQAAGVRHGHVGSDRSRSVVVVPREKVMASAAVEITLEIVPLGRDGRVGPVQH